jgi:hypothetical protein
VLVRGGILQAAGEDPVQRRLARKYARRLVALNREELTRCYEEALGRDLRLASRLILRFSMGPDGSHADLRVADGRLVDLQGNGCVLGVLEFGAEPIAGVTEQVAIELPIWFWVQHTKNPRLVAMTFRGGRSTVGHTRESRD